ncbi:MAG: cytochrome c [Calditrichaeota bacterium]|nr:MAG: cytochrome c [Calditrichota bacterium]MBL1206052.1 cytochrome c [Calditrichota bacterium]NOG45879.1 c-type cytochrome [Calditrichota bacterium]
MKLVISLLSVLSLLFFVACGGEKKAEEAAKPANPNGLTDFEMENGIGPVKEKIVLGEIDPVKVAAGEKTYNSLCAPCHKLDKRLVGPAQRYTVDRRTPEYILNMIMNPDEMTKKHPTGKELLAEYLAPMTNMNLTLDQAKEVLEYLRSIAKEGHEKNIVADPVFKNAKK